MNQNVSTTSLTAQERCTGKQYYSRSLNEHFQNPFKTSRSAFPFPNATGNFGTPSRFAAATASPSLQRSNLLMPGFLPPRVFPDGRTKKNRAGKNFFFQKKNPPTPFPPRWVAEGRGGGEKFS